MRVKAEHDKVNTILTLLLSSNQYYIAAVDHVKIILLVVYD